jgi:hypothetical protein
MQARQVSYLFVNSKNRITGTPSDFTVNFNNELIKAPKNHYIQLSVEQVSINRSWYSIQEGLNTFDIVDSNSNTTTVTFPIGYYTVNDVRARLQQVLSTWNIIYDKRTNKFNITRPSNAVSWYKFIFFNTAISNLLGYDVTEQPTFTLATMTLESSKPARVNEDASILIHTDITRQKFSAIDNITPILTESDVLCSVPIQSAPFDNVVYIKSNDEFTYNVLAPSIHRVRFYITNEEGTPLQLAYDWNIVLGVKYIPFEKNDVDNALKDIRDMVKLFLLQNMDLNTENNVS